MLDDTLASPARKRGALPPPAGRDQAERNADAQQDRPEEQPNIQKFYSCPPRRGGAEGQQQTPGQTRSRRKKQKRPPAEREAPPQQKINRPDTRSARRREKSTIYISFLFFFFRGKSVPRPENPYRFPPSQNHKTQRGPRNPLFMGFFGG